MVGSSLEMRRRLSRDAAARGYSVDAVGLGEALWCWPIDGYDLVLIDASEHAAAGLELCEYIKQSRPGQKVAILVGDRAGRFPFRLKADAVLCGKPDGPEVVRAVDFLLREQPGAAQV